MFATLGWALLGTPGTISSQRHFFFFFGGGGGGGEGGVGHFVREP